MCTNRQETLRTRVESTKTTNKAFHPLKNSPHWESMLETWFEKKGQQ